MCIRPYFPFAAGVCMLWCLPACNSDVKDQAAIPSQRGGLAKPLQNAEPAVPNAETLATDAVRKPEAGEPIQEIGWAKTYTEALEQARGAKKLVMVDFYTDW